MNGISRRTAIQGLALAGAAVFCAAAQRSVATERAPLAIRGYDPVAYFTLGSAVRGLPEFEYEWDEHRYRFARAEHRDLFKADPVRYAPQFTGFCAMALSRGEVEEANPEYWLVSDGKLYLFGKALGPALMQQDLGGNLARANEHQSLTVKR